MESLDKRKKTVNAKLGGGEGNITKEINTLKTIKAQLIVYFNY